MLGKISGFIVLFFVASDRDFRVNYNDLFIHGLYFSGFSAGI
jgi:hypothetical protein